MISVPPRACYLQCQELVAEGAEMAETPAAVVAQCDITFAMLADPEAALNVSMSSAKGLALPLMCSCVACC